MHAKILVPTNKKPKLYHRGPIYRVLPRFSVGLPPHDQPAIATNRPLHSPNICRKNGMIVRQALSDKSGEYTTNHPSMDRFVYIMHKSDYLLGWIQWRKERRSIHDFI